MIQTTLEMHSSLLIANSIVTGRQDGVYQAKLLVPAVDTNWTWWWNGLFGWCLLRCARILIRKWKHWFMAKKWVNAIWDQQDLLTTKSGQI